VLPVVHAEISRFLHGLTRVPKRIDFIDLQAWGTRGFLHTPATTFDGARCAALISIVLMADVASSEPLRARFPVRQFDALNEAAPRCTRAEPLGGTGS